MLVGPVFTREAVTAPRRARMYIYRSAYAGGLWVLMCTAWMVLTGTQLVRNVGDLARFGAILFQILAPLQLAIVMFFAALSSASAVSHEKDRRTLILLLLTRLTNSELVLGKLLASMLHVLVLLAGALPVFMIIGLFGGVSFGQIARLYAVTAASAFAAGSLGSTIALWREKTFQALALTTLVIVFWIGGWEVARAAAGGQVWAGLPVEAWAASMSPWRAVLEATQPRTAPIAALGILQTPVNLFVVVAVAAAAVLNLIAIGMVRIWNPTREARAGASDDTPESIWSAEAQKAAVELTGQNPTSASGEASTATTEVASATPPTTKAAPRTRQRTLGGAGRKTRHVWDNPILWREVRTWAYGRKVIVIRLAYLVLFALAATVLYLAAQSDAGLSQMTATLIVLPLMVVSLMLINAQAVTSLTSERDVRALDLLLVTDLSPKEFIYGKIGGVLYNTKEILILPLLLCGFLWYEGAVSGESLVYIVGGLLVMYAFVTMLGIHTGMAYGNSRLAIATSLGTVFFLLVGIATCMRIMVAFGGSFQVQLAPFLTFMLGGGVGLYIALGIRNPSPAITLAALTCPFATFYAITSFLLDYTLGVFLVTVATYGFTTTAMLIPAIFEFDVATGRTTGAGD